MDRIQVIEQPINWWGDGQVARCRELVCEFGQNDRVIIWDQMTTMHPDFSLEDAAKLELECAQFSAKSIL